MIINFKKFNKLNENYKTGYFNYNNMPLNLHITYNDNLTTVNILYKDKHYTNLSTHIPDSKSLNKDEFYMNPNLNIKLINELINQGFIEKTNKKSMAGELVTYSYIIV